MATCYIISGPNGAGKTTFALQYLRHVIHCDHFINADLIADGISPLNPAKAQLAASKLFLKTIREKVAQGDDFSFETTLSGKTHLKLVKNLKNNGWKVVLFYLWIPNVEFSAQRVQLRVEQGGHDISIEAIERRYARSLNNLMNRFLPICDKVVCYDNSGLAHEKVFVAECGEQTVFNTAIFEQIKDTMDER